MAVTAVTTGCPSAASAAGIAASDGIWTHALSTTASTPRASSRCDVRQLGRVQLADGEVVVHLEADRVLDLDTFAFDVVDDLSGQWLQIGGDQGDLPQPEVSQPVNQGPCACHHVHRCASPRGDLGQPGADLTGRAAALRHDGDQTMRRP